MTQLDDDYAVYAARTYGTPMPKMQRSPQQRLHRAQRRMRIGQKIMLIGAAFLLLGIALSTFSRIYGH